MKFVDEATILVVAGARCIPPLVIVFGDVGAKMKRL